MEELVLGARWVLVGYCASYRVVRQVRMTVSGVIGVVVDIVDRRIRARLAEPCLGARTFESPWANRYANMMEMGVRVEHMADLVLTGADEAKFAVLRPE
jgi:hypothetical protein